MNMREPFAGSRTSRSLPGNPGGFSLRAFATLLLFAAAIGTVQASVPASKHLSNLDGPEIENPDTLVGQFLEALDRGELKLFGQTLDRSMVVPVRIEYVFELLSRTTRIKVHSNLKQPLPVPGQPDCRVLGVSAVMEGGTITEIESHVWVK